MRHFKFEVQSRNFVSRMVIGIGELRYPIQQLSLFRWSLVDAGEKIDQMFAGFTCSLEIDNHVALGIEAASISHVRVIVGRSKNVVVFGPADALQVNGHWRSRRSRSRRHTDDTCFYGEVSPRHGSSPVAQFERMLPTRSSGPTRGNPAPASLATPTWPMPVFPRPLPVPPAAPPHYASQV